MQTFTIKVNDYYYAGVDTEVSGKYRRSEGWYTYRTESDQLLFTRQVDKIKRIEGLINLNSHYQRIYNAMKYDGLIVSSLVIKEDKK